MGTENFQETWLLKSSRISSRLTKTSLYDRLLLRMKPGFTFGTQKVNKESIQWRRASSSPPSKFRTQPSAGKIMAAISWDNKRVLLIDYLPDKTTMNGQYYANLLLKLRQAIKDKWRGMLTQRVWLLHDNSPVHKSTLPSKLFATVTSYS